MWTKCIDRLRELIEVTRVSFSVAATKINQEFGTTFTRNACIGQASRKGIVVPVEHINSGKRKRKRGKSGGEAVQKITARRVRAPTIDYPSIMDEDIPFEQRRSLVELTEDTCRWPLGDGPAEFFCGAVPLRGESYCGPHCARAYKPRDHSRSVWVRYGTA